MKRTLIFLLGCFFYLNASALVQTQLDKTNVASDEPFTLIILSQDHLSLAPDLAPLKKDFNILGTSHSSSFKIINTSISMETQWQVSLMPKHTGELQIPALIVGKEKTQPQIVHVTSGKTNLLSATSNNDFYIEGVVIPKESFVQEQFVYTVKFYISRSIGNPNFIAPDLVDAQVLHTSQDVIYSVTRKGHYYRVLEQSFLITPSKAGHFKIQPPMLTAYLETTSDVFDQGFGSSPVKPIKIVGPTLEITVKPKPINFTRHWLPAKKVSLNDKFEPDLPIFREGEPVTRVVEVTAEGATGDQIPDLMVSPTSKLNIYTQQPKRVTDIINGQQLGKLTQRVVIIPTTTGKLTLPAIKVRWWNSTTQHEENALLPEKIIKVLPGLTKVNSAQITPPQPMTPTAPPVAKVVPKEVQAPFKLSKLIWPTIAILFIVLWIVTLMLWRRQMRNQHSMDKRTLKQQALKMQIKDACLSNQPKETRNLFLTWAGTYWKNQKLHSLADIVAILEKEKANEFIATIMELEAIFYARNDKKWAGEAFWNAFSHYLNEKESKPQDPVDPLPPLYCSSDAT